MKKPEQNLNPSETENTDNFSAEEITDEKELREYFELYSNVWGLPPEFVAHKAKIYKEGGQMVYVVKDETGKIVAGGKMRIVTNEKNREAYFNNKIVAPDFRGKNLDLKVTQGRLERAKKEGCELAYALVVNNNISAIKSILKNGFIIERPRTEKFYEDNNDMAHFYYVSINIKEPGNQLPINEIEKAIEVESLENSHSLIMIDFNNTELIDSALKQGYKGLQVLTQKDAPKIQKPMMVLQK